MVCMELKHADIADYVCELRMGRVVQRENDEKFIVDAILFRFVCFRCFSKRNEKYEFREIKIQFRFLSNLILFSFDGCAMCIDHIPISMLVVIDVRERESGRHN